MDVGIRELKEHLSEIVERAAHGETIRITNRGIPKAVLAPLSGEDRIRQGIREGWITPPRSTEPPRRLERVFRVRAPVTLQEILDEDRGDERASTSTRARSSPSTSTRSSGNGASRCSCPIRSGSRVGTRRSRFGETSRAGSRPRKQTTLARACSRTGRERRSSNSTMSPARRLRRSPSRPVSDRWTHSTSRRRYAQAETICVSSPTTGGRRLQRGSSGSP